ncbi:hypothetical protein [Epilithonimonas lactis]|uniref:Uncharacterized protein n=1 Tax=Epilithonimonas lactis TaxID=421072 RepID=A0A085BHH3_9FLAO|nr:hypothetical protein [Epilithonimonas lactis]KFC21918.1 hypothetical protein IO89_08035 [Epilithonimonas lactis]SEQ48782.1 hypothetical protein SAMN04488097_2219 [Epilithonimonas lactis]
MKKAIFLLGAFAALSMTSCKKEEVKTTEPAATVGTTEAAEKVENVVESSDLPKFSDPAITKFAEEYNTYVKDMMAASKAQDATKIQELTAKAQEWATKAQTAMAKMTPEDQKLWTEYYTKLSQDMTNAAMGK